MVAYCLQGMSGVKAADIVMPHGIANSVGQISKTEAAILLAYVFAGNFLDADVQR